MTIQTLSVPDEPGPLSVRLAEQTFQIKRWLKAIQDGIPGAMPPGDILDVVSVVTDQVRVLEIAVGMQMLATAQALLSQVVAQRDEVTQERDDLQAYVDDNEDYIHLKECSDCLEEFIAEQLEARAMSDEEDQAWLIQQLRSLGNPEGAALLEAKLAEAQKLKAEADALLDEAQTWQNQQWKAQHNAALAARNAGLTDGDTFDAELELVEDEESGDDQ